MRLSVVLNTYISVNTSDSVFFKKVMTAKYIWNTFTRLLLHKYSNSVFLNAVVLFDFLRSLRN